ncbi:MAG TPA: ABC transporter permease [Bryobacteraceae bacterium]|nr:ABC transporter permease [Bryobacteraceae bacterium]
MWERIGQIVRKEFYQLLRNRRTRIALFAPPLVQLFVFGYAVSLDVDDIRLGWMDEDHTPASRSLLAGFQGSTRFHIVALPNDETEAQNLLERGNAHAVLRVLPGFAESLERGHKADVQLLVDGSNSNTASLISGYSAQIVAGFATPVVRKQQGNLLFTLAGNSGSTSLKVPRLNVQTRVWFNADLLSRNYFVPGVIVNLIMLVTVMLTAMAVVRERELGTMEQLMVTPIRPIEFILGKTLPAAVIGLIDMCLVVTGALVVFKVPFRGNPFLLLSCVVLFLFTTLGAGLLLSTISNTQQQAMMTSFLFATPAFMLSGFAFPIRNMPVAVQYFTFLNPLRYFMEIVRSIFLKGTGADVLWPLMLAMLVFGVSMLLLSTSRFRKRLD